MIPGIEKIKTPSAPVSLIILFAVLFGLALFDNVIHPPIQQPTAHLVLASIDLYQGNLSSHMTHVGLCKFIPTCSDYMRLAVMKYGSVKGVAKGLWRICRCSPSSGRACGSFFPAETAAVSCYSRSFS